jgi:hypothetical protein
MSSWYRLQAECLAMEAIPPEGGATHIGNRSNETMSKLKELFGKRKNEIWEKLVIEFNQENPRQKAEIIEGQASQADVVRVQVGEWTVTLDNLTTLVMVGKVAVPVSFTRFRAPYVNADNFRFKLYNQSAFSWLGKYFGMQDIIIGDQLFDDAFVIQGTDEAKVRALLANEKIRQLIAAQPQINLEVKDDEGWFGATFPAGVDELSFSASSVIDDVTQLKQLFALFAEILNQLCLIGSAYETDPQVTL